MNKHARKKIIKRTTNSQERLFSLLATIFSLLLIVLGVITLVVIQQPIKQSQDLRKSAMVENGLVNLSYQQAGDLKVGKENTITFSANTSNAQIDGVQLVFKVTGKIENLTADTIASSGLNEEYLEVEKTSTDSWLVGVIAAKSSGSFSSSSAVPFFKISYTPTQEGIVKVELNKSSSKANITNSNPPQDQLKTLADFSFTIIDDADQRDDIYFTNTTSITYYDTSGSQIQPETIKVGQAFKVKIQYQLQNTLKDQSSNDQTPITVSYYFNNQGVATQTFSYNMLKMHRDGYGSSFNLDISGSTSDVIKHQINVDVANAINETNENNNIWEKSVTIVGDNLGSAETNTKSCNETCDTHTDCKINLGCFNINNTKRCRLATNVTSDSCAQPTDNGISRSCDEYCSDSSECADAYFCYYNRCRIPENPENASCAALSSTIASQMAQSCNQSCTSNRDCSVNMRCYNGACRLASNPSSSSCSPYTHKSVSSYSNTKGGVTNVEPTVEKEVKSTATSSAKNATSAAKIAASASPTIKPSSSPVATVAPVAEDEQTALDAVTNNLKQRGLNFPIAMIGSGILIIVMIIIFWLLKKGGQNSKVVPKNVVYQPSNRDQAYLKNLQQQIHSLEKTSPEIKQPTVVPPSPAPSGIKPIIPTQVIQPVAQPPVAPNQGDIGQSNPMLDRLKEKGIKLPE